ncbi:hypothetical protein [Pseudodesulfovibrio sp.]|uniref:hypothetical protein n=1 Tax=unclassified Pseudodesulfovibrio TaxID=2661612 RepID=UPI003B000C22
MNHCLLGPGNTGKTCYLYLMRCKLLSDFPQTYNAGGGHWADEKSINMGQWPLRGELYSAGNRFEPPFIRITDKTQRNEDSHFFPDLAGGWCELVAKIKPNMEDVVKEAAKSGRRVSTRKLLIGKELRRPFQFLSTCSAYHLFLDLSLEGEAWDKNVSDLQMVVSTLRDNIFPFASAGELDKPVVVVLNKSDTITDEVTEMYQSGEVAKKYLVQHRGNHLIAALHALFKHENIHYVFHSNVGKTKSDGNGGRLPDYDFFYSIPGDVYCGNFRNFIEKVHA